MRRGRHPRRRWLGRIGRLAAVVIAVPIGYCALALALVLPRPAGMPVDAGQSGIPIYACDNGVHVDVVMPVRAAGVDWREWFRQQHFVGPIDQFSHIGFGWGSKDFYLQTPQWRDLRPGFALKAVLWDETVLHVEYRPVPRIGGGCARWLASTDRYRELAAFVQASLEREKGEPFPMGNGYGAADAFFSARGHYTIVRTCNQWSGEALSKAGAPVAPWTPFSFLVMWHLPSPQG